MRVRRPEEPLAFSLALEREHAGAQLVLLCALTTVNALLSLTFLYLFRPAGPLLTATGAAALSVSWLIWTRSLTAWILNLRTLAHVRGQHDVGSGTARHSQRAGGRSRPLGRETNEWVPRS